MHGICPCTTENRISKLHFLIIIATALRCRHQKLSCLLMLAHGANSIVLSPPQNIFLFHSSSSVALPPPKFLLLAYISNTITVLPPKILLLAHSSNSIALLPPQNYLVVIKKKRTKRRAETVPSRHPKSLQPNQ